MAALSFKVFWYENATTALQIYNIWHIFNTIFCFHNHNTVFLTELQKCLARVSLYLCAWMCLGISLGPESTLGWACWMKRAQEPAGEATQLCGGYCGCNAQPSSSDCWLAAGQPTLMSTSPASCGITSASLSHFKTPNCCLTGLWSWVVSVAVVVGSFNLVHRQCWVSGVRKSQGYLTRLV